MNDIDRIERQIQVKAPLERVWHAISHAPSFGQWFGVDLGGQAFVAGERTRGRITSPPGYEHLTFEVLIDRVEPRHYLSFRWHPFAVDIDKGYSSEPTALVEFELAEVGDGTLVRVVESGFDAIPLERRAEAYRMNSGGWEAQMENIRKHVEAH